MLNVQFVGYLLDYTFTLPVYRSIIEMSSDSAEFAWNSVDVLGDDGLLHNGRVVDIANEGLVVHFGGTGHSGPKLIPFGDAYHRFYSNYLTVVGQYINEGVETLTKKRPVEVLLRLQPEDPWKWYPGLLLEAFGMVSVTLPDRELKGFVVEERIRERSSNWDLECLKVEKGRFSRKLVTVPSEFSASFASDDQLIATLNAKFCQRNYWMMATHVLNNAHHGMFKELAVLGIFDNDNWPIVFYCGKDDRSGQLGLDEIGWAECYGIRKECQQPFDKLLLSVLGDRFDTPETLRSVSPATVYLEPGIQSLYRDPRIIPEIFQCQTTLQQTALRPVCRQWNTTLTSDNIRRVVTVSPPCYGTDYTTTVYQFASCLYNCWTQQTRVLVLYGNSNPAECDGVRLADTARLLQRVVSDKRLPAVEVVLLTREWHIRVHADRRLNWDSRNWTDIVCEALAALVGVCHQVIMRKAAVNIGLEPCTRYEEEFIVLRFADQRITRPVTVSELCAMLNNGLRDLHAEEMERLEEWFGDSTVRTVLPWQIAQVLNITQTQDTRENVRHRGMCFYGDADLDRVDIKYLTKLTLHALLQRFQNQQACKIVIDIL